MKRRRGRNYFSGYDIQINKKLAWILLPQPTGWCIGRQWRNAIGAIFFFWSNLKDKECKRTIKASPSYWGILYKHKNTMLWLFENLATSSNESELQLRLDWLRTSWSKAVVSGLKNMIKSFQRAKQYTFPRARNVFPAYLEGCSFNMSTFLVGTSFRSL